jgi:anti-anti-sigma factor
VSSAFRVQAGSDGALCLAGNLDVATVDELEAGLRSRLDGDGEIVLDLTDLEFIDSIGIRSLVRLAQEVDPRPVVLRDPSPNVQRTLDMVRLGGPGGVLIRRSKLEDAPGAP